jgi:diaminohydroxyphosphoribosylaminopyrimidine deaminase/5-amino-6-(5-phosphoribosylamino)uracil reductase
VKNDKVIGSGWHKKFGSAHAEINALNDCRNASLDPADSEMYVTLEPCCHLGKTGPCTKAIIDARIKTVFVAAPDPAEYVGGKGLAELKKAGIEVHVGLCQKQAVAINPWFYKFHKTKTPWVIIKWAQSIDGKLVRSDVPLGQSWISNPKSRNDVHKLRQSVQGIMVGIKTVLVDDPFLTARPGGSESASQPKRFILDASFRTPLESHLLKTANASQVVIITTEQAMKKNREKSREILKTGASVIPMPLKGKHFDLPLLLKELARFNIVRLLVEGGADTIVSFLQQNSADEARIYIAPEIFGNVGSVYIADKLTGLTQSLKLNNISIQRFDDDLCVNGYLSNINNLL